MDEHHRAFDSISVTGKGQVEAVPDRAVVVITVEVSDRTLARAQSEANRRMAAVLAALRAQSIADERSRTAWYDVTPQRDYRLARWPVLGYSVSHRVRVTVEPIERVGEVIDAATASGATSVELYCFDVADPSAPERDARIRAMADAHTKAAHLAELAGRRLGKAVQITVDDSWPRRRRARDYSLYTPMSLVPEHQPTEVRPEPVEFSITVSVTFTLED
ncbi:SIMPL domain-containing protein [Thermomicrobiaceae bacterium CFH 74404]|uniref:SIMPL domain-containing protein n=1 Tax=Thermalbibacter longus TaxID=2951981 RepID=A0AA42BAL2_9BACT|nr:SIMPL domain-containing protein [Thermalbibacter longus]MCM8748739.1 SIMPL domain-containing protein [Thermalbibacter longus]